MRHARHGSWSRNAVTRAGSAHAGGMPCAAAPHLICPKLKPPDSKFWPNSATLAPSMTAPKGPCRSSHSLNCGQQGQGGRSSEGMQAVHNRRPHALCLTWAAAGEWLSPGVL